VLVIVGAVLISKRRSISVGADEERKDKVAEKISA